VVVSENTTSGDIVGHVERLTGQGLLSYLSRYELLFPDGLLSKVSAGFEAR
jgi:hypothetical protein